MGDSVQDHGSLRTRAFRASTWSGVGFVGSQLLRLASSLILTRLLTPDLFGVMSISTIVQTIFALLSDVGIRQSVIQNPRATEPAFLNTIWSLQVFRGLLIWSFSTLTGVAIYFLNSASLLTPGSVYTAKLLPILLFATGAVTFVDSFNSPKSLVQQRQMSLKVITYIDLSCQVANLLVTLVIAWWSRSIWAIIAGGMTSAILHVLLSHACLPGQKMKLTWDRAIAGDIVTFGRWIVISSSFSILATNADRILLGSWVTPDVLGFYAIALSLFTVIMGAGDRLMNTVVFPMLSEAARESPQRLSSLYQRLRLPNDLIFMFISGGLFASADWIVRLLFDPRYVSAGNMLKMLSLSMILGRYGLAQSAYLAAGRTSYLSALSAVLLVGTWIIIPISYHLGGLQGALLGIAFKTLPTVPLMIFYNSRLGLNNWRLEIGALVAWPAGYAMGHLVTVVGDFIK
jgi:O-antigen/teichoic acid export membrane protein